MKVGIDLGSTLTKVAFKQGDKIIFLSSANFSISQIAKILKQNNITTANIVGINSLAKELNFLKIKKINFKNKITREIKLQVKGLEYLNAKQNRNKESDYLLVSIGTGISYTRVNKNKIIKIPLGNPIGGGFIFGLSKVLGYRNYSEFCQQAKQGNYKKTDKYFKDLIVSNLANVSQETSKKDLAAGIINVVAISIMKDLLIYNDNAKYGNYKNIIFIGSTLMDNKYLIKLLKQYTTKINKQAIFIDNSQYALALGALLN